MEVKKTPYYYLSGQRTVLMGLAILWVLWFHSEFRIDFFPWKIVNTGFGFLKDTGYGGVDIFLLISGIGIYQSLDKNPTSVYFKNRLRKILPVWWAFMVVDLNLRCFLYGMPIGFHSAFGYATFTGFWLSLPDRGNWYVHAIMLFYLVSPVLYALLNNSRKKKRTLLILLAAAFFISLPFLGQMQMLAFSRTLIFIFGMYLSATKTEGEMTRKKWGLCIACFFAGFLILGLVFHFWKDGLTNYALNWWPFLLIAPAGALMVSWFFGRFQKQLRHLSAGLSFIGKASLEILLTSDLLFFLVKRKKLIIGSEKLTWLIAIAASVVLGLLIHQLIEFCKKKWKCSQTITLGKSREIKHS